MCLVLVNAYLDFACSSAVQGGGKNKELALHILYLKGGDILVSR